MWKFFYCSRNYSHTDLQVLPHPTGYFTSLRLSFLLYIMGYSLHRIGTKQGQCMQCLIHIGLVSLCQWGQKGGEWKSPHQAEMR